MPIYEYACLACGAHFEKLVHGAVGGRVPVVRERARQPAALGGRGQDRKRVCRGQRRRARCRAAAAAAEGAAATDDRVATDEGRGAPRGCGEPGRCEGARLRPSLYTRGAWI